MSKRRPASHLQKTAQRRDRHATATQHVGGTASKPSTNATGSELRLKRAADGTPKVREVKP
jgi:hypothetical protein